MGRRTWSGSVRWRGGAGSRLVVVAAARRLAPLEQPLHHRLALARVLTATDLKRGTWTMLNKFLGMHKFRIGGKNEMERSNVPEVI